MQLARSVVNSESKWKRNNNQPPRELELLLTNQLLSGLSNRIPNMNLQYKSARSEQSEESACVAR